MRSESPDIRLLHQRFQHGDISEILRLGRAGQSDFSCSSLILHLQTFIWKPRMIKVLRLSPGGLSCSEKLLVVPKYSGSKGTLNWVVLGRRKVSVEAL